MHHQISAFYATLSTKFHQNKREILGFKISFLPEKLHFLKQVGKILNRLKLNKIFFIVSFKSLIYSFVVDTTILQPFC